MNKYIDRYIFAVVRRCPAESRNDIEKELRANIYDMLPEKPTYEEIDRVLHEIGHPAEVAYQYSDTEKEIINKMYYSDFIFVNKIALIVVLIISVAMGLIGTLVMGYDKPLDEFFGLLFDNIVSASISNLAMTFVVICIIFIVLTKIQTKDRIKNWSLKGLSGVPSTSTKKTRRSVIVEVVIDVLCSITIIILFFQFSSKIGWYNDSGLQASLFKDRAINLIILSMFLGLVPTIIHGAFYIKDVMTTKRVLITYLIKMAITTVIGVFISAYLTRIVNSDFYIFWSNASGLTIDQVTSIVRGIGIAIGIICIISGLLTSLYKMKQYSKHKFKEEKASC